MPIQKTRVAVLRGGDPSSFSSSIDSGKVVLSALAQNEEAYEPLDIFISKDGVWHFRGLPVEPHMALKHADIAFNTLPSDLGALQTLQGMHVPYVGSEIVPQALLGSLYHTRKVYEKAGLPTSRFEIFEKVNFDNKELVNIFRNFAMPVTIRTHEKNSPFVSRAVSSFNDLVSAVSEAFKHTEKVVVEELMKGKHAVVSIIENARNERLHALLPTEIKGEKMSSPGSFSTEEKRAMEDLARAAHKALGLRHFSSSSFLIGPKGKIHILETNTFPEMREDSALRHSLKATGWKEKEFVEHLLNLARK